MREEDEALAYIIGLLDELHIDYAVGGSLASAHYGEPRATMDADIIADLNPEQLARALSRLRPEEFYFSEDAAAAALRTGGQFNIIHIPTSFKIDIFVAADPDGRQQLARARVGDLIPGLRAKIAAPEEVILHKLRRYQMGESDKHLRDIAAMLQISPEEIDRDRIDAESRRLGVHDLWTAVLRRVDEAG